MAYTEKVVGKKKIKQEKKKKKKKKKSGRKTKITKTAAYLELAFNIHCKTNHFIFSS